MNAIALTPPRVFPAAIVAAMIAGLLLAGAVSRPAAATAMQCPGMQFTISDLHSATLGFGVDDDVEIFLNGTSIFLNNDFSAGNVLSPVSPNVGDTQFAAQTGDQLRIVAWNSPYYGNSHVLIGHFALWCDSNGSKQALADGTENVEYHPGEGPNLTEYATWLAGAVFYDKTFTINFVDGDVTAPTMSITNPADGAVYLLGQQVFADYDCTDETGGTGVATCTGDVADGAALDTSTVGSRTLTFTTTDNAGNTRTVTRTYTVVYDFSGFFQPVDNLPVFNAVNAGRAIPIKFSLNGNQGLGIFATGYPKSQVIPCDSTDPVDGIEATVTAGSSTLSYDPTTDQYNYVWKTEKSWAGTCRQLVVKLIDGTSHRANFLFR